MGFKKQQTAAAVVEDNDAGMEASMVNEPSPDAAVPVADLPDTARSTPALDKLGELADELEKEALEASSKEKSPEEPEPEIEPVKTESLDDQLLAGGGMELSDDELAAPAANVDAAPAETGAAVENVEAGAAGPDDQTPDGDTPAGTKPRLERMVGNGSPLSPNAQRKAALDEKAERQQGYGGGGGGGIGSLFAMAGQGVKSVLSGVGTGVKRAGGQKLADRFLQPSDPVSVAKRAFRQRYSAYDGAVNDMNAATEAREAGIDRLNDMIVSSEAGRTLKQMAETSKVDLHDFMSDVKSGKNRDPFALKCMESLESNPNFGQAAKSISAAQEAYTRLASDHGADINVPFEGNRLVDAVEKAETNAKKPLPLEVSLKDGDTGAEEKLDTEKQHKKFMEALDKIKESIAALLQKIMSKLGMGGPK
jgi:hypothetical protein